MRKNKSICICFVASLLLWAGCATKGVIPVGKDTYMVQKGGWPSMNGFACEAQCYKAANAFCAKRGLAVASAQSTVIDGEAFSRNASCKLVFTVTNAVATPKR